MSSVGRYGVNHAASTDWLDAKANQSLLDALVIFLALSYTSSLKRIQSLNRFEHVYLH